MVSHIVLMKPRADLTAAERQRFVDAFARAVREIPSVRQVRVGRRILHGAAYEAQMPDAADYVGVIDFDNLEGLQAYLRHPAHDALGTLFYEVLSSGLAYDFEAGGLDELLHVGGFFQS